MKTALRANLSLFACLFCLIFQVNAQNTQTIRGRILDSELKTPLIGATVVLVDATAEFTGTTTDENGYYRLENVPVGRRTFKYSFVGYKDLARSNIIVTSGKQVILNIELEESTELLEEVEIVASSDRGEAINEMATVSARQFSVEETERYAGSRGDPARMVSNFAGVGGSDDSRNDIVVRGNSPLGVLYRYEGVDMPNPNHFAIPGSGGGPVSILNNKVLSNSDFFSGAFPAEFGNSIAGVFDLKMRVGNNEDYEFTGQFGFLGTELTAEGPLNREKKSSFLVNYRYSSLAIFTSVGVNIGTSAVPRYQDGSFKLNFPGKKGGNFSVFGIGGASEIDILISDQVEPTTEIFGDQDRDQYFKTGTGLIGANYTKALSASTYFRLTVAGSHEYQNSEHQSVFRHAENNMFVIDSLRPLQGYDFRESTIAANFFVNKKLNTKNTLKFGSLNEQINYSFIDTVFDAIAYDWRLRWDYKGGAFLFQPYVQWKHRFNDDITLVAGVHSQIFTLNGSVSPFEPRVGLKYKVDEKQSISLGYGLHSQLQPSYVYFYHLPDGNGGFHRHNEGLDFTKSQHVVAGYDRKLGNNARIKFETYYQALSNVPVGFRPSSFTTLNQGAGFDRFFPDTLANTGTGQNYGVEITLEKFFSKKFFFMTTASLFESKYTGSDGVTRDTDFNGNWIVNVLFGKEFKTGERSTFGLGGKVTAAGGKRISPVDTAASTLAAEIVFVDSTRNTLQLQDYFRADIKLNYRINAKKVSHEIGLDLVNIFNVQNILKLTYAPDPLNPSASPVREEYQLGFLPIFFYKIDF